jgi:MSHA type pilus biogenesis protein MshL
MKMKLITQTVIIGLSLALSGCGASNPPKMSEGHIKPPKDTTDIPQTVSAAPTLPAPEKRPNLETYTVVVNQVPVRDLLFSMARDAKLNLDIDDDIKGQVTMNAIDQTLPKILERLAEQVPINYQLEGDSLHVMADKPYLQTYEVDYLNMSRNSTGNVEVATEINSTGAGASTSSSGSSGSSGGNNSNTKVKNTSDNNFWQSLAGNIANIIGEDTKSGGGKNDLSNNIIVNRESGYISVRATSRQQKQVQKFLAKVMGSAKRQVLIEATIAEVTLSDTYQAGIDWSVVNSKEAANLYGNTTTTNENATQNLTGGNLGSAPVFTTTLLGSSRGNALSATLKALETFGNVKVLSSPKVMALNNQTAMLKVVDNQVYFTTKIQASTSLTASGVAVSNEPVVETQLQTVPIGFVMSVTPYIDKNDVVMMNVRPTISRIVSTVDDPNPVLAKNNATSSIPVIQVREIESMLKINNGDTAVIGGLMQDQVIKHTSGVPILSSIPFLGNLFSYRDDEYVKSELVIFIRPVVMHDASLNGDLKDYRKYLNEDVKP